MTSLTLEQVNKHFGDTRVLHDINLSVADGEFVVFVGPSGCGKSTLLRCISGLEPVSSGEIAIGGQVVNHLPPARRGIAMVFQSYALYPHMSVYDNMAYSLRLQRKPRQDIDRKVRESAEKLQLTPYLDRQPKALSGGQRQRVAIGRAIVRDPKLFLFDEPLSNLDAALRVQMRIEIAQLSATLPQTTFIYVTHDQVEAMTLANRIVVLKDGVVQQVGTPLELYEKPNSLFVAGFIGSPKMNFFSGAQAEKYSAETVGVRAEHMQIVERDGVWSGTVIYSENLGSDSFVYLDAGAAEPVVVRLADKSSFAPGDRLHLAPREGLFHRFDRQGLAIS
ncbi:MAG: sn-glycerol-3-phosphate ABC transporter ATP-binding protein UgpC [Hyphomicrobiaceae bacterium]|nr:sn-glycerol-3-phosphate ABC transporter ATP-binding protein UgpC [Hyphomicrobiaceae bacterium]